MVRVVLTGLMVIAALSMGAIDAYAQNEIYGLDDQGQTILLMNRPLSDGDRYERAYLRRALLSNAVLTNIDFTDTDLSEADLSNADLSGSRFTMLDNADISGANLTGAVVRGSYNLKASDADFTRASLSTLQSGVFVGCNFTEASMSASCTQADYTGAVFTRTAVSNAEFGSSLFCGADLSGAIGLESSGLGSAIYSSSTQFPPGFDPAAAGMILGCIADLDFDLQTDVFDFGALAANFGSTEATRAMGDLNGDCKVDVFDFSVLASDFGCGS